MKKLLPVAFSVIALASVAGAQTPQSGASGLGENGLPRAMDKKPRTDLVRGNVAGEARVPHSETRTDDLIPAAPVRAGLHR